MVCFSNPSQIVAIKLNPILKEKWPVQILKRVESRDNCNILSILNNALRLI